MSNDFVMLDQIFCSHYFFNLCNVTELINLVNSNLFFPCVDPWCWRRRCPIRHGQLRHILWLVRRRHGFAVVSLAVQRADQEEVSCNVTWPYLIII